MMSLAGASRAVVPALDDFAAALPAAAEGAAAPSPAPGAARAAGPDAAEELAGPPEHPARNSPPASMAPPMAAAAAPDRVRLVRAGRRFKLSVFSMRV